jgi:hypothetical protein
LMFIESLYLLTLLLFSLLALLLSHSYIVLYILILFCLPLLATLLSVYCAPFVPTDNRKMDTMIKMADLKSGMKFYDLGAGDGRILIKAEQLGAKAVGYEVSFPLILTYYFKKIRYKLKAKMYWKSLWRADVSDADVIFVYLLVKPMKRFFKIIYPQLKTGTKIISNTFEIPGIKAKKIENGVYLYIK